MSLALAMIAGGDDPIGDGIEHAIRSAQAYVDEVCIWANGPRAGDLAVLCGELGAVVEVGRWSDDFSAARNASFAMTSADWIVSLDANDELIGGERLREVVDRADAAAADIAWCFWDRYENGRHGWWPTLVRAGTGAWQGVVHECWRHPGIDRWRHGVGQAGSVHVHPAAMRVYHRDRATTPFKYLALLERAATDPPRTPWALAALSDEISGVDALRALALMEQHHAERWDAIEGDLNGLHAATLKRLSELHARAGNVTDAERYRLEWDVYTRRLTLAMGEHAALLLQLGDERQVQTWAAMTPDAVDALLDSSAAPRGGAKAGRNEPCPCGSGRKFKRCHGA
jgi:hypothetical protein